MKQNSHKTSCKKPAAPPVKQTGWLFGLILFGLAFMVYFNTIRADYVLDDVFVTQENHFVQKGVYGIGDIFTNGYFKGYNNINNQLYRPLVLANFAIEKEIFGNNAHVNHFFNVLFYAISAWLLFLFLSRIFPGQKPVFSFLITALFITHPIHTEVVANIKSRDEILAFLFMVLTLIFLLDYFKKGNPFYLVLSVLLSFFCVMTKESGLTIVAIVPLTIYFFTPSSLKKGILATIPFIMVALLYLMIRDAVLDPFSAREETLYILNNSLLGAKNTADMLATTFVTLGMYLKLLVVPYPLCYDYSFNQIPITTWTDWRAIGSLLIYTTLGIYCLLTLKKKNIFAFCIAFFFITFSVSSNLIVKIGATFGERFLYTPLLAFCIAIVVVVYRLFNKIPGPSPYIARGAYVVFFLLVFTYSFLTIRRNPDWNNNLSLFLSGVKVSPNSAKTQFALGLAFYEKGMNEKDPVTCTNSLKKSIDHYKKSVTIYPLYSHAWYNLGLSYYQAGKKDSAMAAFKSALAVRPDYKEALMNLSNIYSERGEWKNALDTFLKLLGFDPDDAKVLGNIGVAYQNLNQFSSAISYYEKAIAIDPNSLFVYKNLIVLYKFLGDPSKASYYEKIADKLK